MKTLIDQIIDYCAGRDTSNTSISSFLDDMKSTFPKCNFQFYIEKDRQRLAVTHNFYVIWFEVQYNDLRYLRYLTIESLK